MDRPTSIESVAKIAAKRAAALTVRAAEVVRRLAAALRPARYAPVVEQPAAGVALPAHVTIGAPLAPYAVAAARRAAVVPEAPPAPASDTSPSPVPDLVVVDDDPAVADMLRYALRASGVSFHYYSAGPEALAALLALDTGARRPVILLDADLPGLDGFSLHERLRAERPGVYATVFVSARTGEAEQLRAYRAGALDYLAKPVNMRILMAKVPLWVARAARPT